MAFDRGLEDRDHPDPAGARHGAHEPGLGDAEYRLGGGRARLLETGVGEAGDDEGRGALVLCLDPAVDRRDHGVDVFLGPDPRRPLGQRQAFDLGRAVKTQGIERLVDAVGAGLRRIGIDDDDAVGHG